MDGGTHFADWSLPREGRPHVSRLAPRRVLLRVVAVVVFSVVTTFCGDRLGDALGSREHELAEGVRNVGFLGWFFLTFPGYDLATGSRFASTRGTRILVAVAALPISVSVAYLI